MEYQPHNHQKLLISAYKMDLYCVLGSALIHDLITIVGGYAQFAGTSELIIKTDSKVGIRGLVVLNTGELVSTSRDYTIKIWDPLTGSLLRSIPLQDSIEHLVVMPSGVLIGGSMKGTIYRIDPYTGEFDMFTDPGVTLLSTMTVYSDRRIFYGYGGGSGGFFDVITGRFNRGLELDHDEVTGIVVGANHIITASIYGHIKVWDRLRVRVKFTYAFHKYIKSICLLPRNRLACGSRDNIFILNLTTRKVDMTLELNGADISCVVFSEDTDRLFSGGGDGIIQGWDVNTGMEMVAMPQSSGITKLLILPNKKLASGTAEGIITVWD